MATGKGIRTVELVQAFLWTCEDCGQDNFERAITVSPEEIDPEDLPEMIGSDPESIREWIEAGGGGEWVRAPDEVHCKHCGETFGAASAE